MTQPIATTQNFSLTSNQVMMSSNQEINDNKNLESWPSSDHQHSHVKTKKMLKLTLMVSSTWQVPKSKLLIQLYKNIIRRKRQ